MPHLPSFLTSAACFADMHRRPTSTGLHLHVLDGVRGAAALIVMHFHFAHMTLATGPMAVWLFFCLSGFLLVQPFCNSRASYAPRAIGLYYLRRVLRIMPMFIVAVLIMAATGYYSKTDAHVQPAHWAWMHLTFQWADMVLWSVKQEMIFYLLMPAVMALFYFSSPESLTRPLALLALALGYTLCGPVFAMNAIYHDGIPLPLFAAIFLGGMASGCFVHTNAARSLGRLKHPAMAANLLTAALLLLGWAAFPWFPAGYSGYKPLPPNYWWAQLPYGFLMALLLSGLVIFPKGIAFRLFNLAPMRAVGVVGYSFYLWHDTVMSTLGVYWPVRPLKAAAALLLTYALSCLSYCLVERPFMNLTHRR